MPYLLISNPSGKKHFSVLFFEKHRGEYRPKGDIYIKITDEQAQLPIADLEAWYHAREGKTIEQIAAEEAHKKKGEELLERLADIIRQSHHEGERENAKALYLKYAGRPFVK